MKNWKDVPMPENIQQLPKYRGLPIAFTVLVNKEGVPMFTTNDHEKITLAITKKLCGICGKPLLTDMWFIGGPGSAFDPKGAYIDAPVHHACGTYALQVCPFLAYRPYKPIRDLERLSKQAGEAHLVINQQADPNRPPFFVFAWAKSYKLILPEIYFKPEAPWLAVEYWKDAHPITRAEAKELIGKTSLKF